MNTKLKIIYVLTAAICLLAVGLLAFVSCIHKDPIFNIENNFNQPVTVYFQGQKMGKINPGQSKIFYPNDVLTKK